MGRLAVFILIGFALLAATGIERSNAGSSRALSAFACTPIPIPIGGSTNGELETGDCVDTNNALYDGYTFTGTTGEPLDITLFSETFVPSLRLVQGAYPGGSVIATGTDPGNGSRRISAISLPAAGIYTVVASSQLPGISGLYTVTLETTNPRVEQIQRINPDPAAAGSTVAFGVTFTSVVTGVDAGDFALSTNGVAGAAITNVAGTGSIYTVAVNSGVGSGSIRLDVVDNDTIVNGSSVPLGGPGTGNGSFTSGPSYTIVSGTPTPTPTPSQSAIVTNTLDSGPGSLRQAVADVASGGSVTFSSLFSTPQTILLSSGEIRILKNVNITGPGASLLTVSGNNANRVFNIGQSSPGHTVAISGLTVANGRAPDNDFGGGIEQNFGTLTLSDCAFTGNSAPEASTGIGGAIDFFDGVINISNCEIVDNSSTLSGAGIAVSNAVLNLSNTTVDGNDSSSGGGLHIVGGSAVINGSTFSNNHAGNAGGAIFAQNCGLTVTNSTISANTADLVSGIAGAIIFESRSGMRTAQITSTTIANNTATPSEGGGIYVVSRQSGSAALAIRNSILAWNSEPSLLAVSQNGGASIVSQGFNLASGSGNGLLVQPSDRVNSAPGLGPLQNNGGRTRTHSLLASSAAIDAGNSFGSLSDQRGALFLRPVDLTAVNTTGGDGSDIGAFELQSEPPLSAATVSGRVTTPAGLGLRNAIVSMTDPQGVRRTATTSSFGVFSFASIPTGISYIVSVSSKRYRFSPQSFQVNANLSNVDFVGLE